MRNIKYIQIIGVFICLFSIHLFPQTVRYVNWNATGLNNGTSWANAYTSLETAISNSASGDQIWVAAGTYKPTREVNGTGNCYTTFVMKTGLQLYGGFSGSEASTGERDLSGNETILSGDTGVEGDNTDNSYHVIYNDMGSYSATSYYLDGLTITGGYDESGLGGGGIYFSGRWSSINITNCKIRGNYSGYEGGGVFNVLGSLTINNSVIENNSSLFGGGLYEDSGSLVVKNSIIRNNSAWLGGGLMHYSSTIELVNGLFYGNNGQYGDGGAAYIYGSSTANIVNCTFTDNTSANSGGALNISCPGTIVNTIIWNNNATEGKSIHFSGNPGDLSISNSCYSTAVNEISGVAVTVGAGNITSDPSFIGSVINPDHPYLIYGLSECVDAGNNTLIDLLTDVRLGNNIRKADKNTGGAGIVDMGAYEYQVERDPYDENGPLPVEMVSFTGKFAADCITLRWETKTEIDNYGFEIERSKDGDNWTKIGFIEGAGTSNSPKYYSFEDKSRLSSIVRYRLKQLDNTGTFAYSDVVTIDVGIPKEFNLSQNFPNPFNPTTTINFDLSEPVQTTLSIYNIAGEIVKTLVDAPMEAGRYGIVFDASALTSGIYFYRLQSGKFVSTKKLILLK